MGARVERRTGRHVDGETERRGVGRVATHTPIHVGRCQGEDRDLGQREGQRECPSRCRGMLQGKQLKMRSGGGASIYRQEAPK